MAVFLLGEIVLCLNLGLCQGHQKVEKVDNSSQTDHLPFYVQSFFSQTHQQVSREDSRLREISAGSPLLLPQNARGRRGQHRQNKVNAGMKAAAASAP
jgi:hypothetical protein